MLASNFRYGRRPIFFISLVLQVVGGILAGLAPEYYSFVFARMCIGASTSGVFLVAYVIGIKIKLIFLIQVKFGKIYALFFLIYNIRGKR